MLQDKQSKHNCTLSVSFIHDLNELKFYFIIDPVYLFDRFIDFYTFWKLIINLGVNKKKKKLIFTIILLHLFSDYTSCSYQNNNLRYPNM